MAANPPEPLPHLRLRKLDIERPRRKHAGRVAPPERENAQYAPALLQAIRLVADEHRREANASPPEFDPALVFKLRMEAPIAEDTWRRTNLSVLSDEPDGVVVLFAPDQLAQFSERVTSYGQPIPEGQKHPDYAWVAALTTEMALWGSEDRRGAKLSAIDIHPDDTYLLDVEIWQVGALDEIRSRMDALAKFIERSGGRFLDSYLGGSLSIARVSVQGRLIDELLHVGIVKAVDLPPQPDFTIGPLLQTPIDAMTPPVNPPPEEAPRICIIDSGITTGHPLLGPAIGYSQAVPSRLGDGADQHGHGTMTSGIALYGDVKECIDSLSFSPGSWIFAARVTNARSQFDDERLIVNQMSEAIELFAREYRCRVFNVSLGDPKLVFSGGKPSPWAQVLDTLARDLDVLIVVSAGNIPILGMSGDDANDLAISYPAFLLSNENAIIEPATAANVLTVGSLAHSESSTRASTIPNDPSIRCLAPIECPSPFTRHGPGVNGAIKPDLVEYGGNATWCGRESRIFDTDPGVSIVSMHHRPLDRMFAADVGTSYSAARVSHLAGRILASYPAITSNTVRALIANACRMPSNTLGELSDDQLRALYGYGRPLHDLALYSTEQSVTMYSEDQLPLDALHIYELPLPEEFKQASGRRMITVTLAFSPPVRHTRKDYIGVKMSFRLFRGLSPERIVQQYAASQGQLDIDTIEPRLQCPMTPSPTRREAGTLQRAVFIVAQNRSLTAYPGDSLLLLVRCNSGWATPNELRAQDYSLVVNIAHLDEPISLYNAIQQRARVRRRVRIPA